MIVKNFEIHKINISLNNLILFYGKNDGFKNEEIIKIITNFETNEKYDEKQIIENLDIFFQEILNGSLFQKQKCIIINNSTDKILKVVDELIERKIKDIWFIFNADNLDKKSKLRKFFETEKRLICVPFYPDNNETLFRLAKNFLNEKKILLSSENINLIVNKCNGNRGYLNNELKKIELFSQNKKKILTEDILKLINLTENFEISDLVDSCLAKNIKKIVNILNENNFNNEDSIIIARTFLNKVKKILKLSYEFEKNKNIDLTIKNSKPPIFWKDKEIVKQQLFKWKSGEIEQLIYDINEIELQIKNNSQNQINIISNFLLEKSAQ
tara:strand:- start:756 stop:1736 length:981 start_codon:yes stop_codon:yes gene_type:complete